VYGLAIRMLWHPEDAEDATQEILVKVVTGLASFRGDASVRTWAYRIATNHLLTTRRRRMEQRARGFHAFAADLAEGLDAPHDPGGVDERLLVEEVKVGCTQGMLLCLDREHRLAYILGEVFGLAGEEAASIAGITGAAHRKRLERARGRIRAFMTGHCGIVDPGNPCRCSRRVGRAIQLGRVDPGRLLFATHPRRRELERPLAEMQLLTDASAVFRSHPAYRAPDSLTAWLADLVGSGRLAILRDDTAAPRPGGDDR
jgi:RNA polymerase sigma factor (sigma-70 family)